MAVLDSSGRALMSGWETNRWAARYHGARVLFLLLIHRKRNTEDAR
jgi:hypothetical protein